MEKEKDLIMNNGTVDEELLRGFFAGSVRMHIADNGFSHSVMKRVHEEMPARGRFWYNVWTAVWMVVCVVSFFVSGGLGVMRRCLGNVADSLRSIASDCLPRLSIDSLLPQTNTVGTTLLMVVLTVWVLSCVMLYDFWESQKNA